MSDQLIVHGGRHTFVSGNNGRFFSRPDKEVVRLANEMKLNSRGTLDFKAAKESVLRANPELAKQYIEQG